MKLIKKVINFYYEGFQSMTTGRKLWLIIIIKLFIMFGVMKIFFFHNFLDEKFKNDKDKSNYVIEQFTR